MTNRNSELVKITHLLFVDDTLIFYKDTEEEMVHLSWILLWFEAISRQKINFEKSTIIVVGEVENLEDLALELGCKTGTLPTTYLGLPLGMHRNSISILDGVEERIRKKFAFWKRQYISNPTSLSF